MPRNEEFLRDFFKESQEHMRFRSGVEYRLLQFLLLFYPIIGVVMATLYRSSVDQKAYFWLSIGATAFLVIITVLITIKICAEHKTYRNVGQSVKKVWRYFKLQEVGAYLENDRMIAEDVVNLDPDKGYGTGKGYILTLLIVWAMALAMMALTIILGILALTSEESKEVSNSAFSFIPPVFGICSHI